MAWSLNYLVSKLSVVTDCLTAVSTIPTQTKISHLLSITSLKRAQNRTHSYVRVKLSCELYEDVLWRDITVQLHAFLTLVLYGQLCAPANSYSPFPQANHEKELLVSIEQEAVWSPEKM